MKYLLLAAVGFLLIGCAPGDTTDQSADLLLENGSFFRGQGLAPATAVAIKGDRIIAVDTTGDGLEAFRGDSTKVLDLEGRFAMPGFIEGHAHFSGLGSSLQNLNFLKSRSWEEIVAQVAERAETTEEGAWITGRGWHQEKWDKPHDHSIGGYPIHDALSELTPDNPVVLRHASGHSLYANAKAMELAGVSAETPDPRGGRIVRDGAGAPIGVFEERAMSLITTAYQEYLNTLSPEARKQEWLDGIALAEAECLRKGVTSFQDAGSSFREIEWYQELAEAGELDLRLWAMVRHPYRLLEGQLDEFPIINAGNHFFTSRAIKTEVDGALGAYGAWLLEPYNDKPGFVGQNTTLVETVDSIAGLAEQYDLQLCVHAIGDRANREVLDIIERRSQSNPAIKEARWRIEHSQHLHPDDIPRFAELGVIPSMQGIHCTSDAPFVVKRLGEQRAREGAYPWKSLLESGAVVTNGTDAPVEDVSALESYYATVTRKRADSGEAFFPEQALTREEGLHSYTLAPAYSAFEETDKGTLEVGKLADIVVLSNNLLDCPEEEILNTEVILTMVGGVVKYQQ